MMTCQFMIAAAGLPPVDGIDHSGLILGTNMTCPRMEIPVGTEPRLSNVSGAPLCSTYGTNLIDLLYDDAEGQHQSFLSLHFGPNDHCTTVRNIFVVNACMFYWPSHADCHGEKNHVWGLASFRLVE